MKKLLIMVAAAGGASALLTIALVATASAHARYSDSTPARGAVLQTAPTSVVINFVENIQRTAGSYGVTVTRDGGGSVTNGAATVSGDSQLTIALQAGLTAGRYVVNWNNTSEDDGDPLSGAFSFYVTTKPTAAQLAADQQLAAVEANELATATADAAGAATPVVVAAPAVASTPAPASSPSATLPRTGDGSSAAGHSGAMIVLTVLAMIGGPATLLFLFRRAR